VINVDGYGEGVAVPSFGPRMVCTCCGIIGADLRPNWSERAREPDGLAVGAAMEEIVREGSDAAGGAQCFDSS
jgi:hypothetical protein